MKSIGGYFELELKKGEEFHAGAIKLNLARTAFEYVLRAKKIRNIFLPYYTCEVVLESVKRVGVEPQYYQINEKLEPVFDFALLDQSDYFLYTNYFGLKREYIDYLSKIISNLIIDNSQAFFEKPIQGLDTFYSPRKFFGVPDGGYLYTDIILNENLDKDYSIKRFDHLIGRTEESAEKYFEVFKNNDNKFRDQPIKIMSNITQRLLMNIDYSAVATTRMNNYKYLHNKLISKNIFTFEISNGTVPMVYPFFTTDLNLRKKLIENRIYVPTYWKEIKNIVKPNSTEYNLVDQLIPLPIDQRYSTEDMQIIVNTILKYV